MKRINLNLLDVFEKRKKFGETIFKSKSVHLSNYVLEYIENVKFLWQKVKLNLIIFRKLTQFEREMVLPKWKS